MATWERRNGGVYVWVSRTGKQRQVPRDLTRHLDGADDAVVDSWAENYDAETRRKAKALPPLTNDRITRVVEDFCNFLLSRGRDPSTVSHHRGSLLNTVVPYLLSKGIEDVQGWPGASVKMLAALQERGLSHHQITKCNIATSLFLEMTDRRRSGAQLHKPAQARECEKPHSFAEHADTRADLGMVGLPRA
jgi:hypothetical protein